MKKVKVAINGFGRIGRAAFKVAFGRPDIEVVAINDLTANESLAHLLRHDSTYGVYNQKIEVLDTDDGEFLVVNGRQIPSTAEPNINKLNWAKYDVDVVLECTGRWTTTADAKKHITKAGAKRVVVSAPIKDDSSKTIVVGVNEDQVTAEDTVISNASCTTNCIGPVMAILEEAFGIEKSMMTTVHAVTATQPTLDSPARDLRMSRSAAFNIIPTTTGVSKAAGKILPSLNNTFEAMSLRVPVPVVSMCDFVLVLKTDVTAEQINNVLKKAAREPYYQGILEATDEELVSSDFIGNPASVIVDLPLTKVVGGNLAKVVAWYDNEWGYSNRLVELAADFGKLKIGGKK